MMVQGTRKKTSEAADAIARLAWLAVYALSTLAREGRGPAQVVTMGLFLGDGPLHGAGPSIVRRALSERLASAAHEAVDVRALRDAAESIAKELRAAGIDGVRRGLRVAGVEEGA